MKHEEFKDIYYLNKDANALIKKSFLRANIDNEKPSKNKELQAKESLLIDACKSGDYNTVLSLLKEGVDANSCIHQACTEGNVKILELLLKYNADPKKRSDNYSTPLHFASYNNHRNIIEILLRNEAYIDALDICLYTPLHLACLRPQLQTIKTLLENGANVNAKNIIGRTSLMYTCLIGSLEVSSLLIH